MKDRREKEYFTLSSDVRAKLLTYIENNNINKSKLIEKLIVDYLNNTK